MWTHFRVSALFTQTICYWCCWDYCINVHCRRFKSVYNLSLWASVARKWVRVFVSLSDGWASLIEAFVMEMWGVWWTSPQTWQSAVGPSPLACSGSHGVSRRWYEGWKAVLQLWHTAWKVRARGAPINDRSLLISPEQTIGPGPGWTPT